MNTKAAHEVFIGVVALIIFVTAAIVIAGESETAGKTILALFVAFLALQLMTHGSLFNKFLSAHPVITGGNPNA